MIDLKQLIAKVVVLSHAEKRRTVRSFEVLIPEDLPPLRSDTEALEQVLLNLLINAVHACDKEDSRVGLRVGQGYVGGDDFSIEISDNGSGIEETLRDRIFDPFFTTKPTSIGTVLGLCICHQHVESLGGSIEVESSVGQGTTFRVLLPQPEKKLVPESLLKSGSVPASLLTANDVAAFHGIRTSISEFHRFHADPTPLQPATGRRGGEPAHLSTLER
jgi:signal transduction histidine kinase